MAIRTGSSELLAKMREPKSKITGFCVSGQSGVAIGRNFERLTGFDAVCRIFRKQNLFPWIVVSYQALGFGGRGFRFQQGFIRLGI